MKKITKDNDYILALKANHPLLEQEVKEFFLAQGSSTRTVYATFDTGHGRIERRIYTLDTQIGWFEQKKEAIIRRIVYNRIKMLSQLETLS